MNFYKGKSIFKFPRTLFTIFLHLQFTTETFPVLHREHGLWQSIW